MKLIDIHCHIIPGVDDGAKNKAETLKMLEMMREDGVVAIIATPHYRPGMFTPKKEALIPRFHWAKTEAKKQGIYLGMGRECYVQEHLLDDLSVQKCRTLLNTKYLLVEFSSLHSYNVIRQYVADYIANGYIPIIAHIERVAAFEHHEERIQDIRDLGAHIQVNADSVVGERGVAVKRRMLKLLKLDLVHYIASDSHGAKERIPNLGKCYRYVAKKMGEAYADEVFYENQKRIIIEAKRNQR